MAVLEIGSAAEFLARTERLRAREPVLTNLLASVALGIAAGRRYDRELLLVVTEGAEVVGCALRTDAYPVVLSPMPDAGAVELGRHLPAQDLSALVGPASVVAGVVEGLGAPDVVVERRDVVRVLREWVAARPCDGAARPAVPADEPFLLRWSDDFAREVGLPSHGPAAAVAAGIEQGRLRIWEVDGVAVAFAGHAVPVPGPGGTVGRIGPVYTPRENRGRGYASALTSAIAGELLAGCELVMLFADAANAGSNSIYARLGFDVVDEVVEVHLVGAED